MLHYLSKTQRFFELCGEFGIEFDLLRFLDELEGKTAKSKVLIDHFQLLLTLIISQKLCSEFMEEGEVVEIGLW